MKAHRQTDKDQKQNNKNFPLISSMDIIIAIIPSPDPGRRFAFQESMRFINDHK